MYLLIHSLHAANSQPRLGYSQEPELWPGLPCGWQGPKCLTINCCYQDVRYQKAESGSDWITMPNAHPSENIWELHKMGKMFINVPSGLENLKYSSCQSSLFPLSTTKKARQAKNTLFMPNGHEVRDARLIFEWGIMTISSQKILATGLEPRHSKQWKLIMTSFLKM